MSLVSRLYGGKPVQLPAVLMVDLVSRLYGGKLFIRRKDPTKNLRQGQFPIVSPKNNGQSVFP